MNLPTHVGLRAPEFLDQGSGPLTAPPAGVDLARFSWPLSTNLSFNAKRPYLVRVTVQAGEANTFLLIGYNGQTNAGISMIFALPAAGNLEAFVVVFPQQGADLELRNITAGGAGIQYSGQLQAWGMDG